MRLGKLIELLDMAEPTRPVVLRGSVHQDTLGSLISYRGYYDHLAIDYKEETPMNVEEFITMCREAVGQVFTGYKGGDYEMGVNTPVWVSAYGEAEQHKICNMSVREGRVVIETFEDDYL